VRVGKALFRVIGLLSEKGQTSFGFDQDQLLLLPITTLRSQLLPVRPGEVSQLLVSGAKGEPTDRVTRKVTALLRQRHKLAPLDEDDFDVRDQARMARSQQGIVEVMRTLLLSIALVSLFIGGVGVANIMLVGVAERSREIGTRLSLGARGSDVLLQFLIEAVLLSLLGGTLGVLCSGLAIVPLSAYFGFDMALQPRTVALAFGLSVLLGILSGFLPARRASRLDPVVALRRE
jgi:putative ABC transport system permease protein